MGGKLYTLLTETLVDFIIDPGTHKNKSLVIQVYFSDIKSDT